MLNFLFRRFFATLITIFLASLLVFCALLAIPGDPAAIILGINASPEALTALQKQLGLDMPPVQRFFAWLGGIVQGDFGTSIKWDVPVSKLITERLQLSALLALGGISLACLIAIPLGIVAAFNHRSLLDLLLTVTSQLGAAIPSFWLAILLILFFGVEKGWLPTTWVKSMPIKSMIMPIIALGVGQAAVIARMTRASMLDVLSQDYVRTAKAKGLSTFRVVNKHALRNALVNIVTIIGLSLSQVIIGTIIIEQVFALPGMGRLVLTAISARDFPLLQGGILVYATIIVSLSFIVDMAYSFLDPRIRYG